MPARRFMLSLPLAIPALAAFQPAYGSSGDVVPQSGDTTHLEQEISISGFDHFMQVFNKDIARGHGAIWHGRIYTLAWRPIRVAFARSTTRFADLHDSLTFPYLHDAMFDPRLPTHFRSKNIRSALACIPGYQEEAGHNQNSVAQSQFGYIASTAREVLSVLESGGDAIGNNYRNNTVDWHFLRQNTGIRNATI